MSSLIAEAYVKIRTDLNLLRSELRQGTSIFRSAVSQMVGVAGGILAAAGIRSFMTELRYVVGEFISVNNMFEQYQVSLGQLFQSDAKARSMILEIQEMARKTPFRMDTLTQSIVQLKIFGFENEKLIPTMRAIGDAAAASPRGMMDGVQRISYAIGEMRSHGRIMAAEMRQLASAGVPAWDLLAAKSGKTIGEMRDLMRKGLVDSQTYLPLLIQGMSERFQGMMEKQSKTWGGLMSTVQDNVMLMFKDVGRPFFDLAKIRLTNLVSFMDSPRYQQFLPQMTAAVRTISELANKKITQGLNWLTGPSAYNFAQRMGEVASEVYRISRIGEAKIMEFLGGENLRTAVGWLGDATVWLTRLAGIGFDNVMDFLRSDTWSTVVRGVKDYALQLYGIAKIGFERSKEFFQSGNFSMLTGEAKKLFGWMMEIRRVVLDFAKAKLSDGLAWLKGDAAAGYAAQFKAIALEVYRIAGVTASNFWTFLTSDTLKLIVFDLRDAALHIGKIAGVKLMKFSEWLNSAEASAIASGIRDITKNLIYLIDNYGGMALGIGIMVHFRSAIAAVAAGIVSLASTISAGGLLSLLSPQGILIAGIVAIGAAFVAARLEGVSFFEYLVMMLGRVAALGGEASDSVSELRRNIAGQQERGKTGGKVDDALQGPATDENIKQLEVARDEYDKQEAAAREVLRKKEEELRRYERMAGGNLTWKERLYEDSGDNFASDIKKKKEEIASAQTDVDLAAGSKKSTDQAIKDRRRELDQQTSQRAADAKIERDADKATSFQGAIEGMGGMLGALAGRASEMQAERRNAQVGDLFNRASMAVFDQRKGGTGFSRVRDTVLNDKQKEWFAEKENRQLEYLEGKNNLSKVDKSQLDRLRKKYPSEKDEGTEGDVASGKKGGKGNAYSITGIVEFTRELMANVNGSKADESAAKTADNTAKTAIALDKIVLGGVKIKDPQPATTTA